jgi:hypothetical protein
VDMEDIVNYLSYKLNYLNNIKVDKFFSKDWPLLQYGCGKSKIKFLENFFEFVVILSYVYKKFKT